MDAFAAYGEFLALKRHFTSNYNYIVYNGKVRLNYDKFMERHDKYHFHKLAKKGDELHDFIIANLLEKSDIWVTDLVNRDAEDVYIDWKKRTQSMTYLFKMEMGQFDGRDFDELLRVRDGQHPVLLQEHFRGSISKESMCIVQELTRVFDYWDARINDQIIWPDLSLRLRKYMVFLDLSKTREACAQIVRSVFVPNKKMEQVDI